jgi:IS30 family transposase
MKTQARTWLKEDKLSPELISAKGRKELGDFVSHETIYKWIWLGKHSHRRDLRKDKMLHRDLKHHGRRRKRGNNNESRSVIKERVSIEKRPKIINQRKRIGDKEADLVLGKNRRPGLLVLTDRKLRMNWLEKIESKEATYIEGKIRKMIRRCNHQVKSITFDNDLAFAQHYKLKKDLKIKTYFTHPFTSQEKGTIENRIGVIRRFFPKGTDFTKVTAMEVREVENKINQRPMRMFKYASPQELYTKKVLMRC